jgi:hypothetical protein
LEGEFGSAGGDGIGVASGVVMEFAVVEVDVEAGGWFPGVLAVAAPFDSVSVFFSVDGVAYVVLGVVDLVADDGVDAKFFGGEGCLVDCLGGVDFVLVFVVVEEVHDGWFSEAVGQGRW